MDELFIGVNIALGTLLIDRCLAFDVNGDRGMTIGERPTALNDVRGACTAGQQGFAIGDNISTILSQGPLAERFPLPVERRA